MINPLVSKIRKNFNVCSENQNTRLYAYQASIKRKNIWMLVQLDRSSKHAVYGGDTTVTALLKCKNCEKEKLAYSRKRVDKWKDLREQIEDTFQEAKESLN